MIPFLAEFEKGKHVKLGDIEPGARAIILSLHFRRALIVQVTKQEDDGKGATWVHGHVVAPIMWRTVIETFSRRADTLAVALTADEAKALLDKYAPMVPAN